MVSRARDQALNVLSKLQELQASELDGICSHTIFQIKPWLDLENSEVKKSVEKYESRQDSEWAKFVAADGPASKILNESICSMQKKIGSKGSLLTKIEVASIEKIREVLSAASLQTLGSDFAGLDSSLNLWQKAQPDGDLPQKAQDMEAEAQALLHAGKVLLAVQSGALGLLLSCHLPVTWAVYYSFRDMTHHHSIQIQTVRRDSQRERERERER